MTDLSQTENLFQELEKRAKENASHVATRTRRGGSWEWMSWGDWHGAARASAAALCERGVAKGDRVAIFSSTREEWAVADFGVLGAGAVTVPLYPTSTSEQAAWILADSEATLIFVEGPRQLDVVRQALSEAPALREVVVFDAMQSGVPRDGTLEGDRVRVTPYMSFLQGGHERLLQADAGELLASRRAARTDLATIVYTSGTTGNARGAMLTHGALLAELSGLLGAFSLSPDDEQLLLLPLSHILARVLLFLQVASGSRLAFAADPHRLVDDLAEVEPTFFAAVPRFFEKMHAVAEGRARAQGPLKAALWSWALGVGQQASRAAQRGDKLRGVAGARARYADELVLRRIRKTFGRRLRFAISGGAPLAAELAQWFHTCGVLVLEGYGLTETCGATHVNRPDRYAFGTVGLPLGELEVRLADDGEILVRGPTLMKGYFKNEEATRSAMDADGFFHTGDIGRIQSSGFLTIVDRKKDVLVTAGGSTVAPQNIERMLAASPWISHAVVFGDKQPYLVALLTLDAATCGGWAKERRRAADLASLSRDPELGALVKLDVDAVNRRLSSYETVKRHAILERDLTIEDGELTDTHKVRRGAVERSFGPIIESLYRR